MSTFSQDEEAWQYAVEHLYIPGGNRFTDIDAARHFLEMKFLNGGEGGENDTIAILAEFLSGKRSLQLRTVRHLILHLIHSECVAWKAMNKGVAPPRRQPGHVVSFTSVDLLEEGEEKKSETTGYFKPKAISNFRPMSIATALLWTGCVFLTVVIAAILLSGLK